MIERQLKHKATVEAALHHDSLCDKSSTETMWTIIGWLLAVAALFVAGYVCGRMGL